MSDTKKARLSSITDEVGEFHPLLNKLLCRLPNVVDVEYTHGPEEMGADFVVSRRDETFGHTEYVGVIAKVGRVVQDYSYIERQIEECEVPRTFFGGKESIRITEIWVMVTEHITKGAQRKIHEKYKLRKITFIDGPRLEKLIDKHIPTFWTELTLEVGDYLTQIRIKNKEIEISTSLLPYLDHDFYIEPEIFEVDSSEYNIKKQFLRRQQSVNIYDRIDRHKLIFIEGGMGAGKTKLVRHLIDHYANPEIYLKKKLIPIYTTYKNLLDKFDGNVDQLIRDLLGEKLINELEELNCLILIDAVDEKDLPSDEQVKILAKLIDDIMGLEHVKAIITSRYLREFDQSSILNKSICRCEIRPLSNKKTIEFLRTICIKLNIASRLIEDLRKSQLFKELPRTPISAILLAKLLQDNTQDLPSNMTELYSKYIELILGRWDIDKGLQSQKEYQALDNIMAQFSEYMVTKEGVGQNWTGA